MMKNEFNEDIERGPKCGVRHVQVSLIFLLNFVAYSMRDSVSIAIVAMTDNSTTTNPSVPYRATPWTKILTSLPFLGITLAQFGCSWGDNISFIEMPSYINKILKYNIDANGVVSSLPFLANFILGFIFGYVADTVIKKRIMSLERCRKVFVTISTVGPAICLVSLSFSTRKCYNPLLRVDGSPPVIQRGIPRWYLDELPGHFTKFLCDTYVHHQCCLYHMRHRSSAFGAGYSHR
ncbi:unnamed protein product [Acanthoscelides obtectus]|uniref:Uncharacterized protein n=1 Tax=Acanthoscelides obtectus TaxID=200917 RepID=A0A9P0QD09_ACAOB|nr:unnamed protein product [Acanthoscelides obtectus]CAK1682744.1 Putative inorganic phosphate cotransporter [Acanthoscelides obtectus]